MVHPVDGEKDVRQPGVGSASLGGDGGGDADCLGPAEQQAHIHSQRTSDPTLKNPSDTCEVTGKTLVPFEDIGGAQDTDASRRQPRAMPRPVSLKGKITSNGYEPENYEWIDLLTIVKNGRRIGRDPLTVEPDLMTAAGHAPRRTRSILVALGDEPVDESIIRYKDLRRHCLSCAENKAAVRCCAMIDCPLWPYRMGRNPHNPQRGRNPFKVRRETCAEGAPAGESHEGHLQQALRQEEEGAA